MRKLSLLLLLFCFSGAAIAAPTILIVQSRIAGKTVADTSNSLVLRLAQELDDDGRVVPIAWDISDPIFRNAIGDRIIPEPGENPTQKEIMEYATKLKADYVLIVSVWRKTSSYRARATLFHKGKEIWQDPEKNDKLSRAEEASKKAAEQQTGGQAQEAEDAEDKNSRTFQITLDGQTDNDTLFRSIARTWSEMMKQTPLKSLTPRPRVDAPPLDPGVKPTIIEPAPIRKVDNKQLLDEVMRLLAAKEVGQAINVLRDAVDSEPLDLERRRVLISTLSQAGHQREAASEARRAAQLLSDEIELWTLAAQNWMAAGLPEEAQLDLNEAVARDPQSPHTRILLGDMNLAKMELEPAFEHYNFVIEKSPTAWAYFKRSLIRAFRGDKGGSANDFNDAQKLGFNLNLTQQSAMYRSIYTLFAEITPTFGARIRNVIQKIRLDSKSVANRAEAAELMAATAAASEIYDKLSGPESHTVSRDRLGLALKLLYQAMTEVDSYIKSPNELSLGDATINLGEAFKQINAAAEEFKAELAKG